MFSWLFIHSFVWVLSFYYVRWVYQFKNRPGYCYLVGYAFCTFCFLINIIFIICSIVSMIKQVVWWYIIILICCIFQSIYWMLLTWDIFKIASISVSNYDESYSLLSLLRLSWISEELKRTNKIVSVSLLTLFCLGQFGVSLYSHCESSVSWFSLGLSGLFLLTTLLFLPLYGCQTRTIWLRRVLVVLIPMTQLAFGILSNCYFNRLVCSANRGLCDSRNEFIV
ncbi:uncharacterized protein [Blastocystis hominis]|uniref:Uncharacterized protein n=1 Tax=Blastocystis hominis TaxID=12968 RepID=D8M3X2_BLAHO|nr:uncharacterized protein [Blastocystis hominis]CBK22595.2 unnamed protein product [Blastocystis hominis]|eukprot:XP_012896643.1 uncharacterized protein [Blastocystis hominis]